MIAHYTDLNAVQSILVNSKFWLTDYNYLNDKEEFKAGYNILIEALLDFSDYPSECTAKCINAIKSSVEFILERHAPQKGNNRIFVSSFSLISDSLTQWRSYGMFSIEFDENEIISKNNLNDLYFLECKYILDTRDALEDANEIIKNHIIPELIKIYHSAPLWLSAELSYLIDIYSLTFKHPAFYDEQEVRLVIACSPDDEGIKFRAKGNILIPYLELNFPTTSIETVRIGPIENQELSANSLYMFTEKVCRKVRSECNAPDFSIELETSDIPFRSI